MKFTAILFAVSAAIVSTSKAQVSRAPAQVPFWDDTIAESPIYPVGDAVPVYRAVLDLLYLDGDKRPPVIIMHDSAEGHMGGPCPFVKCPVREGWKHKSRMDTGTVMSYARLTRRRPGLTRFGYPIPIVFLSYDDVQHMEADGRELLASRTWPPDLPKPAWGFWAELKRKYPGAWGVTTLTKVGFNKRHTEALVQAHEWCGDDCRVHETLFLRQTNGRWRVVERIPEEVDPGMSANNRYMGPAGTKPKDSEILPVDRTGTPSEATARAAVYRAVLDSLYFVNGDRPKRVVLTNWSWFTGNAPAHTSDIDSALLKRFSFLGAVRAPFDAISKYRVPVSTLPVDSVPAFRERGATLDSAQTGFPFWVAFANRFPGAWGMLGVSRIAFNRNRSQALVQTLHRCGDSCAGRDTWFLTRSGKTWHIARRIPADEQNSVDIEPLRYVGVDVSPTAYRPRRVQGVVTDENGKALPFLVLNVKRTLNSGINVSAPPIRTDSAGHYTLTNLPLNGMLVMIVPCPVQQTGAQVQPVGVSPGMDTTINISVDFRICDPATAEAVLEPPAAPNPLAGAEAFISEDSARFVFPRQPDTTYEWGVPRKGVYPGSAEYMWWIGWEIADSLAGKAPYHLWLTKRWSAGGPRKGSLRQLIAGLSLNPMIECTTCDGAVFEDPDTDHSKVFATIENGQLVFIIHGAEAVRRIFPTIPTTVGFEQTVRHGPQNQYGPDDVSSSQAVIVNCRNLDASPEARHRCDVKH